MPLPAPLQRRIRALRADHSSGAVSLARRAAAALQLAGKEHLAEAAVAVVEAQPFMAPLLHLANDALWRGSDAACRVFLERLEHNSAAVARRASGLIEEGMTILTHSASETVRLALLAAQRDGKRFQVICTESRPRCEGLVLARALAGASIPVTVIVDAAASTVLREVQRLLVGADAVSFEGVTNKIGTSLLARAARSRGVEVYSLFGSEKIVPRGYPLPEELPKPAREVVARAASGVRVQNLYFDTTPLPLFIALCTEAGIFAPEDFVQPVVRIHPALARRFFHTNSPARSSRSTARMQA